MPRRDIVLTGLIAFGAGVAVGANWDKVRQKIGPLLEKLGLQIADLGDFLSANGMSDFMPESMKAEMKRPRAHRSRPVEAMPTAEEFFRPAARRKPVRAKTSTRRPSPTRQTPRRKRVIVMEAETPLATGTFGA